MNNLKRLCLAIALTLAFGVSVFAGDTHMPTCPPPDPGELTTPPCSIVQDSADAPTPGQTSTPPSASTVTEYVIADTAIDFVESVLSLF